MKELVGDLEQIGFTNNEARVYLSALELGCARANHIAQVANMHRGTCYSVLHTLAQKGLVTAVIIDGHQQYRSETPQLILLLLEMQERELKKRKKRAHHTIERLQVFHRQDTQKPHIRYHEHLSGLRAMQAEYERMDEDILQIVGLDTLKKLYDPRDSEHSEALEKTHRHVRAILISDAPIDRSCYPENVECVTLPCALVPLEGEMTVCGDRLVLFSYTSHIIAIEIHSPIIAQTARATLELAWKEAKRLEGVMKGE